MTPFEAKNLINVPPKLQRSITGEGVTRKPSFKCPTPNKTTSQRTPRRATISTSTVMALASKFNEMSQACQAQNKTAPKAKKSQTKNGNRSALTRKPSAAKNKEVARKKTVFRKQPTEEEVSGKQCVRLNVNQINQTQRNVLQKVTEIEECLQNSKSEMNNKKLTSKVSVPKVLVDIDLDESSSNSNNVPKQAGNNIGNKDDISDLQVLSSNVVSVRTAINIFEKSDRSSKILFVKKELNDGCNKKVEAKLEVEVKEKRKEEVKEVQAKVKPVATIKPILKKPETVQKKLSPNDSLNRKQYVAMKRDQLKSNKENEEMENGKLETPEVKTCSKEPTLTNYSMLFSKISQSNVGKATRTPSTKQRQFASLLKPEEAPVVSENGIISQNLKPNMSFLWSKKEEEQHAQQPQMEKKASLSRLDMPLPLPPENLISKIGEDFIYDDVRRSEFDQMSDNSDNTVYDDIGLYDRSNEGYEKIYDDASDERNHKYDKVVDDKVEKLNHVNSEKSSDSLYYISKKLPYGYEDQEGEGYQYISSDAPQTVRVVSKDSESESYQYIRNGGNESNIYEDIQSVKNRSITDKDKGEIYEDVNSNGGNSVSNCYESVYNGFYCNTDSGNVYVKSNVSDISNNSGRSSYEKSNSLYGCTAGVLDSPELLTLTKTQSENGDNCGYVITPYGTARPNSETSQSNSDEWVELPESESENSVYLAKERPRRPRTTTHKVKRRWSTLQKKVNNEMEKEESKSLTSEDHFYESIGQYENADVLQEKEEAAQHDQSYDVNEESIYDEDQYIDDFDGSQSSDGEMNTDAKLPDVPSNGYNLKKSLKDAGKRLKKNLSQRKSDFSKSLKRFKRPSRTKIDDKLFTPNVEPDPNASLSPETSVSSDVSYVNNSDSSASSQNYGKTPNEFKTYKRLKPWTLRNRFKRSSSSEVTNEESERKIYEYEPKSSTFYLSLNEVRLQNSEKKDDLLNEIQNRISHRSGGSLENVSELPKKESPRRTSQPPEHRLSIAKARPSIPPPPPPCKNDEGTKYSDILVRSEKAINNSIYAESGLFDKQKKRSRCSSIDGGTSWYTEVGLYSASENSSQAKKSQIFVDEPLYQFYTECVNQQARDDILENYDSEGYEEINDYYTIINEKRRTLDIKNVRPNFEDFNDDVPTPETQPRALTRTLWCQIPEVIDSCILEALTDQQKKLQEAKFEILTSEESYMNSLNVLECHFMKKLDQPNLISKSNYKFLFGNILAVKKCSEKFLNDLESCWQDNIMLNGICDIVHKHSTNDFHVYVKYCKNQICIYRTLREMLDENVQFQTALKEIEKDPVCQNLSIHSFLMLPMQRITRLPLLLGAVLARLSKNDDEYDMCKASFEVLNKIVQECDDEARKMEKLKEMLILSRQINFPKEIRNIPIMTRTRFLVKSGQVTQLVNRDDNKLTFGRKFSKVNLTLFLFTDLLVVTKKKGNENYVVVDHCARNFVELQTTEGLNQLPGKLNSSTDLGAKNLMLLTLLENHEKKTVEMILALELESDRQRWLDAVVPKLSENPDESIYEEWDCPQVIALYEFTSTQPDELSLCIGDVVNVLKKMNDGWYQGERLRDGTRGWFPQNHTQEISSPHVRAKNKKQRHYLLSLSENLIESQMKNGK